MKIYTVVASTAFILAVLFLLYGGMTLFFKPSTMINTGGAVLLIILGIIEVWSGIILLRKRKKKKT